MPALLSEVFKETSFTVDDGQIKAHYGKPAPAPAAATSLRRLDPVQNRAYKNVKSILWSNMMQAPHRRDSFIPSRREEDKLDCSGSHSTRASLNQPDSFQARA